VSFKNPTGSDKADRLIRLLELAPGTRALDAGCGSGEFLIGVVMGFGLYLYRAPAAV
jgi:cyclopropane fatty-acyl-phospholipid synthase-like methyltransferase